MEKRKVYIRYYSKAVWQWLMSGKIGPMPDRELDKHKTSISIVSACEHSHDGGVVFPDQWEVEADGWYCKECDVAVSNMAGVAAHMNSNAHQAMLASRAWNGEYVRIDHEMRQAHTSQNGGYLHAATLGAIKRFEDVRVVGRGIFVPVKMWATIVQWKIAINSGIKMPTLGIYLLKEGYKRQARKPKKWYF